MAQPTQQNAYVVVKNRMTAINGAGAGMIAVLTMVVSWPNMRIIAMVALVQAATIAFNVALINKILLRLWGVKRAELFRNFVNLGTTLVVGHVAHWPLPTWFMLPYIALVFDSFEPWVAHGVVGLFCIIQDAIGLMDGAPWIYPFCCTALALFCMVVSDVRFSAMRTMVIEKEAQRKATDEAHARLRAEVEIREAIERDLRQAQKLEALGRVASGVAHEINTPIQFVSDSVTFLKDAIADVFRIVGAHEAHETPERIAALEAEVDMPFLRAEVPAALALSMNGLERVATIVRTMRRIAHPDPANVMPIDVNQAVRTAIVMSVSEYKTIAELVTDLHDVPQVLGRAGEIYQVVLNLIVNASHAVGEVTKATGKRGTISISTSTNDAVVAISIADTGSGIPEDIRDRIFEPFFTTKDVGRGTGQGLAIARSIIERHGGTLAFDTSPAGTTFHIRLPVAPTAANAA